jgi:acylpyruvate hydrolase
MKFAAFEINKQQGLAIEHNGQWLGLTEPQPNYPGSLDSLLATSQLPQAAVALQQGQPIDLNEVKLLPPLQRPPKIICVGLNYLDHTQEIEYEQPDYPTLFTRFASTLIGHGSAIEKPHNSEQLDYEGEIALIIGRGGRHIKRNDALDHIAGWSLFNDASVRDYQFKTPQWTVGKNFDASGAFGPYLVTADEIPAGAKGLTLQTRLNGEVVQSAPTNDMVFDVVSLIEIISEVMTLEPGDVIVTGTPAGVGMAREPQLWMKPGDTVEVEVEGLGTLINPIIAE